MQHIENTSQRLLESQGKFSFQFPVSDFPSVKPALIINALLVNGVRDGVQTVLPEVMRAEGGVEPNDKEKHSFLGRFGYPLKLFEYPNQF